MNSCSTRCLRDILSVSAPTHLDRVSTQLMCNHTETHRRQQAKCANIAHEHRVSNFSHLHEASAEQWGGNSRTFQRQCRWKEWKQRRRVWERLTRWENEIFDKFFIKSRQDERRREKKLTQQQQASIISNRSHSHVSSLWSGWHDVRKMVHTRYTVGGKKKI